MGKRTLIVAVFLGILATLPTVDAQVGSRRLTIDDIYNPTRRINFSGTPETSITWIDPATYLTRRRAAGGVDWLKVDAPSGRTSPLFDAGRWKQHSRRCRESLATRRDGSHTRAI